MPLTYSDVAQLLDLLDAAQGLDLDVRLGGLNLSVRTWADIAEVIPSSDIALVNEVAVGTENQTDEGEANLKSKIYTVMCSSFGLAGELLVQPGTSVAPGDTLLTIQAADGTPVAVKAVAGGRVVDVNITQGALAEYGQVLMAVESID